MYNVQCICWITNFLCRWWYALCWCSMYFIMSDVILLLKQSCLLFFKNTLWKQKEFRLSQLNCSSIITDGLTALTLSPSSLPWVIIILSAHLTFSPGSYPSCFSQSASPLPALLIYFIHPWSHIWTALSLKLSVTNHLWMLNQHKYHHGATISKSVKPASSCERGNHYF